MRAFFLGAGSSAGTFPPGDSHVPVAAQFGKALHELDPNWTEQYPNLAAVVNHVNCSSDSWGLEPVWSWIDYNAKLHESLPGEAKWPGASLELKKVLLHVYGRRCDEKAEQLPLADDYTLGRLLKQELAAGDMLISFNYDTIIERLACRFGHQLKAAGAPSSPSRPPAKEREAILLAKPHGSTSWTMDWATRRIRFAHADGSPLLTSLRPEDVTNDINSRREPLLLGAVPMKSELLQEVQAYYCWHEVFKTIAQQWKAVVEAIHDADTLVVVGYSFPPEDRYGRFLIQEGMRRRGKRDLTIEFFELKGKAGERAQAVIEAFDRRVTKLIYREEVKPPPQAR
jgi:hypothetical protein